MENLYVKGIQKENYEMKGGNKTKTIKKKFTEFYMKR